MNCLSRSPPPLPSSLQADGKVVDGSLMGDANGLEPAPGRVKDSGKWQKPRFSRKALMKCCLVKWIIASTQPQDKGERGTRVCVCVLTEDEQAATDDVINAHVSAANSS